MIAKTHKFGNLNDIISTSIKFQPTMDQTGFYNYNAVKVISDYMCTLYKTYIPSLIPNLSVNISQTGFYNYNAVKVISDYMCTLYKTYIPSLIPNLSVNISQIYHHYKMFHMMLNSYSQTYCKQLITSLNKFMDKVRSN